MTTSYINFLVNFEWSEMNLANNFENFLIAGNYLFEQKIWIWELFYYYKIIAEVGYCGKDTTNSKYTLQGVPEQMSMRHFFLGHLVLLFSIVAWGRPYGFSDFVRELISRLSSHLMLVTVSKSVRGMYVSKFKKSVHGW